MGVFAYNVAEVVADLYARTPTTAELEVLLGVTTMGDAPPTHWKYDPNSAAADDWTSNPLTSTVIKPTSQVGNGRWLKVAEPVTTQIAEGTNLYYTNARFNSAFGSKTTADLPEGSNQYFTNARARSAISLTTTGTSGVSTYNSTTGALNIPNYATPTAPTINGAVSRSLSNAAGSTNQFTISTTRNARVYYSVNVVWNITALLATASTILLEYSTNSGSNWVIANQVSKNINLGLVQSGSDDLNVSADIPANALVRIRPSVSTNSTITYVTGQETLY